MQRVSDITLGDFWAIEKYKEEYDDNKGTSFVLVNTEKGDKILNQIDLVIHKMNIDYREYVSSFNWCMHKNPTGMPEENRRTFYEDVKSMPFDQMAAKDLAAIKEVRKQKMKEQKFITQ